MCFSTWFLPALFKLFLIGLEHQRAAITTSKDIYQRKGEGSTPYPLRGKHWIIYNKAVCVEVAVLPPP